MSRAIDLGRQYLADLYLQAASRAELEVELSDCRRSPTLMGEGAARLIAGELNRRAQPEFTEPT